MFRALRAHHEVKIVLYSVWYRHTCRWPSGAQVEIGLRLYWDARSAKQKKKQHQNWPVYYHQTQHICCVWHNGMDSVKRI